MVSLYEELKREFEEKMGRSLTPEEDSILVYIVFKLKNSEDNNNQKNSHFIN